MTDPESIPPPSPFPTPPREPQSRRLGWRWAIFLFVLLCVLAALGNYIFRRDSLPRTIPSSVETKVPPGATPTPHVLPDNVPGVIRTLQPELRERYEAELLAKGVQWPPGRVRLVGLKTEKQLELWVANLEGPFYLLRSYPVLAASGGLGPKRRQGDRQVPEGHYKMVYLNPESSYHLSLLLDYPNATDKQREADGLAGGADLGGDICIHGSNVSVGCMALGDTAIETVFTFAAMAQPRHRDILILPADFRKRPDLITLAGDDPDIMKLYQTLAKLSETVKE